MLARESLRALVQDTRVPEEVRSGLAEEYRQVEAMLDKLEHGHLHIAVFGRVSVGKSATLNALLGHPCFATSPLHGETKESRMADWQGYAEGGLFLIDTPGINEVDGEARERIAHEVAARADLLLFVLDGDITESEMQALRRLHALSRPLLVVLNKADRYTQAQRVLLLGTLRERLAGLVGAENILTCSADPAERVVIRVDANGNEVEEMRRPAVDVMALRGRIWALMEHEGKTLAALNASLFAAQLSDQVGRRVVAAKRGLAERLVRSYCLAKGVAVALNPVAASDLVAAAALDVGMVAHLSRLYGLPLNQREAGGLVRTIIAQLALLMGTTWAINLLSSLLKLGSGGLSVALTATTQGAVAYYSTYVVGHAAEHYLAHGKSWGEGGPKQVIQGIIDGIDRDSLLAGAREELRSRLYRG